MKVKYTIAGIKNPKAEKPYGVYSSPYNSPPFQNLTLVSTHKTLIEASKTIDKYKEEDRQ